MWLLCQRLKIKILISLGLLATIYCGGFLVKDVLLQGLHCTLVKDKLGEKLVLSNAGTLKKCLKSSEELWVIFIFFPFGILSSCRNFQRSSYLGSLLSFYKVVLFSCDLKVLYKCKGVSQNPLCLRGHS